MFTNRLFSFGGLNYRSVIVSLYQLRAHYRQRIALVATHQHTVRRAHPRNTDQRWKLLRLHQSGGRVGRYLQASRYEPRAELSHSHNTVGRAPVCFCCSFGCFREGGNSDGSPLFSCVCVPKTRALAARLKRLEVKTLHRFANPDPARPIVSPPTAQTVGATCGASGFFPPIIFAKKRALLISRIHSH